ncbi:MAG: DegT/DnrJ/EryC1/StrS family aminotransferase [Phycisphaerae bacterium]|nr:DegT/DnrJ/EryC1/StrS family aminotransferase [Phycisphaerae bacterium]
MDPIPLLDLKAQYQTLKDGMIPAICEVLESQICIGGPKVAELEKAVAAMCDCRFAVGVSSGTDALLSSLMSLEVGPGDEVITTPFTFFATAGGVARVGARPVFVDIEPETFNINVTKIEAAVTSATRAIIPVHLFGQMVDMDPLMAIGGRYKLAVIEDAAQSIIATYRGKKAGSIGTVGCLSFFPSKNLGSVGDAGMVVTNDEALHQRLTIMRNHGMEPKYFHHYVGGNFRLDAIQAAALLIKLPHLEAWSEARRVKAAYYDERFAGTAVTTTPVKPDRVSVCNYYTIRVANRDQVVAHLRERKIGCEIYYPVPLHLQRCFEYLGHKEGDFPESERAAREVMSLPIYPELTSAMQDRVVEAVLEAAAG